jgi:uncharacterized damage-inducible protein DinB
MVEHRTLPEMLADIQRSQQAFLDSVDRANDSTLYRRHAEQEWTIAENLVHVSEARLFFTAEVRRALSVPGSSVGRTITDPARVQNVLDHGQDPRETIAQKLAASYEQVTSTLERMRADDLRTMVEHVKYGPQTLAEFIQHFILEHDQAHVGQIKALLA